MMQKQMSYKKIIICASAVIAVIAAVVIVLLVNREEAFRSILVYEVKGDVSIDREGIGSMNASENLYLESGDRVSVATDSSMRMKLDDDKYVMAEADTVFSVEAQGTGENSKTKINLEQGAITNEIQHPLSEGSQYETFTPNSVMAVRGTIYRVELYTDENGEQNTKLCCFQGKVGATPILPDGTYGEEVLVLAGSELIVYSDGTVYGPVDILYEELPEQTLQNLRRMAEEGQSMTGITSEELNRLAEQAAGESKAVDENAPEQTAISETGEAFGQDADTDAGTSERTSAQAAKGAEDSVQRDKGGKDSSQQDKAAKDAVTIQVPDTVGPKPQTVNNVNTTPQVSASASNTDTGGDDYVEDDNSENEDNGNSENNSGSGGHKSGKDKADADTSVNPPEKETYTVTFQYQGTVFATQEVESGETVSEPMLMPTANGVWDFDFGSEIEADTTIQWKN